MNANNEGKRLSTTQPITRFLSHRLSRQVGISSGLIPRHKLLPIRTKMIPLKVKPIKGTQVNRSTRIHGFPRVYLFTSLLVYI
jgi:hypothetical protein